MYPVIKLRLSTEAPLTWPFSAPVAAFDQMPPPPPLGVGWNPAALGRNVTPSFPRDEVLKISAIYMLAGCHGKAPATAALIVANQVQGGLGFSDRIHSRRACFQELRVGRPFFCVFVFLLLWCLLSHAGALGSDALLASCSAQSQLDR